MQINTSLFSWPGGERAATSDAGAAEAGGACTKVQRRRAAAVADDLSDLCVAQVVAAAAAAAAAVTEALEETTTNNAVVSQLIGPLLHSAVASEHSRLANDLMLLLLLLGLLGPPQTTSITQRLSTLRALSPLWRVHGATLCTNVVSLLGLGSRLSHSLILLGLGRAGARRRRRGGSHVLVDLGRTVRVVELEQVGRGVVHIRRVGGRRTPATLRRHVHHVIDPLGDSGRALEALRGVVKRNGLGAGVGADSVELSLEPHVVGAQLQEAIELGGLGAGVGSTVEHNSPTLWLRRIKSGSISQVGGVGGTNDLKELVPSARALGLGKSGMCFEFAGARNGILEGIIKADRLVACSGMMREIPSPRTGSGDDR